jgi:hypothetical protein
MFRLFLLQHVSVLGDHHQGTVMNEANTVIELFLIRIHIRKSSITVFASFITIA